jgi:aminopeptidase S
MHFKPSFDMHAWRPAVCSTLLLLAMATPASPQQRAARLLEATTSIAAGADGAARRAALVAALEAAGIPYELQPFTGRRKQAGTNIVARIGDGTRTLLVGAHYDRVNEGSGAVDNGAACAALVELLAAFKAAPLARHALTAVFFDLEESGLEGSRAYFDQLHDALPEAAINLDIFAYGDTVFATASRLDGAMAEALAKAAEDLRVPLRLIPVRQYPMSDHLTMIRAGVETLSAAILDGEDLHRVVNGRKDEPARIFSIIHTANDTIREVRVDAIERALPVIEQALRTFDTADRSNR